MPCGKIYRSNVRSMDNLRSRAPKKVAGRAPFQRRVIEFPLDVLQVTKLRLVVRVGFV
jgi:hypothetical protein